MGSCEGAAALDLELEELPLEELPTESYWDKPLYQWQGFWYRKYHLEAALSLRSQFQARDDDIILASPMKTGTTWLKSLCFCLTQPRPAHDDDDPLAKHHPAFYVQTLEVQVFGGSSTDPLPHDHLSTMETPRLFHTHLPYTAIPESMKESKCKIVYIARNPKDSLVSAWHFFNTLRTPEEGPYPLDKAFDSFCRGVSHFGPFLDHILQYWEESLKSPEKVMFLRYEDLKTDPVREVKRLARFLGRGDLEEKEVEEVIRRCDLERLKNLEVNKEGVDPWVGMKNSAFFRKGQVGDWKNLMTQEMGERLDQITHIKLEGSGLHLLI